MCARRSWLARGDRGGAKIEVSLAASTAVSSAVVTTATLPSRRRQQPSKWRAQGLWPARRYRGGRGDRGVATIAASVLGGFLYFSSAIWTGALKPGSRCGKASTRDVSQVFNYSRDGGSIALVIECLGCAKCI